MPLTQKTTKTVAPGNPHPLGATIVEEGVNFALYSRFAQAVFLLLFDGPGAEPTDIIRLTRGEGDVHHVLVAGIRAGQLYGYKVQGEYNPRQGLRFNAHKLLLDPYAKALTGKFTNQEGLLLAYDRSSADRDLSLDNRANHRIVPKALVINDEFDWENDTPPRIPFEQLVIYETHVKGFTAHPSSAVEHPGSYLGLVEKIPYLKELGINALELMPVHEFYERDSLTRNGLSEYWGYNSIGFFAPESSYGTGRYSGCQVHEFKTLVKELHRAGIELILDVVYNHSGEGNELGPLLSLRGIDNPSYYALEGPEDQPRRYYVNDTGTGNTLNVENPAVLKLILDSLRYWVREMHVDGFRFDLASILARVKGKFQENSLFFEEIAKDPLLRGIKLIAEPWDLTSYQVGNFPLHWAEWNGRYRDTLRRFLIGKTGLLGDLARRLSGSQDLYGDDGRSPYNSINFITSHDGFTLYDLFSYNHKHNEANQEDNRDGMDHNDSWNCGVEGKTGDEQVLSLRKRMVKNALGILLFSSGTPMITAGDELGRTQGGNNNPYCQDNMLTWLNWNLAAENRELLEFFKKALSFRKKYPVCARRRFFTGEDHDADQVPDVLWLGKDLTVPAWDDPGQRLLCCMVDGGEVPSDMGDYFLLFILNGDSGEHEVLLPRYSPKRWYRVVDTNLEPGEDFLDLGLEKELDNQESYPAAARAIVVLLGR